MTSTTSRAGGQFTQSPFIVSADQVTILGNGLADDPLRLSGTGETIDADFVPDLPSSPILGMFVAVIPVDPIVGSTSVRPASAASGGSPAPIGIVIAIDDQPSVPVVTIQRVGQVVLTTQQWDVITGETGGLTSSASYFLSNASAGSITQTAPVAPGTFISQVGTAINPTTLVLSTPSFAIEN